MAAMDAVAVAVAAANPFLRESVSCRLSILHKSYETYIEIDKFNIYSYMNSNDIARHCQKIGHKFSPAECAYLANASENHTIAEKYAMFNHIIETMPDEQIKLHGSSKHYPEVSLHICLL